MRSRRAISPCPSCAAQAVLTAALCQEIARLRAEVKRLQAQLAQTSANSHKPPSSDPPKQARVQYEKFYAGASFIVRGHAYRETLWNEFHQIVDDLLAGYSALGIPQDQPGNQRQK